MTLIDTAAKTLPAVKVLREARPSLHLRDAAAIITALHLFGEP